MRTNRTVRTSRALGATALGLTLAFTVAACGDDTGDPNSASTEPSATEHNDADVTFASDMLQHHAQALSMVDLTQGRTLDPEVQAIADEIREAQAPEIESFSSWLTDWDEEVPATMRDHANADHDIDDSGDMGDSMEGMDTDMPGMMSANEMTALESAPDSEFQDMWLTMMIEHHTGAVQMANTETEGGQYKPAIDLARNIIESQSAEIETMKTLLD
ncbi:MULTISPECIES: DUF305 domain-containing protein [Nocardioides]|uniref:DUF305 domain-containing protein n=1 Tax=Nocardioides plantarum TaxID=29299 RepID=A0ABV5KE38_9ACTN|nr:MULTISPECIES: DUF305 domain-containing protein [Nocardioides]